jgi:Xaa-Pro aminopeptidase
MEIQTKIQEAVNNSTYDVIVTFGVDNIQYMSGISAPFVKTHDERPVAIIWPKDSDPVFVVPIDWEKTVGYTSRITKIETYDDEPKSFINTIAVIIDSIQDVKTIGVDFSDISVSLFNVIRKQFEGYEIKSTDELLRKLRITKTSSEIELLEKVAYNLDHGIFGQAHHVLVRNPRTEMALSEGIRVHCMERNLEVKGGISGSQGVSGEHAKKYWPQAPFYCIGKGRQISPGEYVRLEAKYSKDGYWSDGTRLLTMGLTTDEQQESYDTLVALRKRAVDVIKPSTKCSEVYNEMVEEGKGRNASIVRGTVMGHGIGVSLNEPPYISATDDTELVEGMVLVIEPKIYGPEGEILFVKDTVVVTSDGCRVIGWYKNWDYPYTAAITY